MIRVAVVEDEESCFIQVKEYLERFSQETGNTITVTNFQDGMDITEEYRPLWDIILMDIRMKHMDGMAAAREIRKYDSSVIIIFITSMAKYAIKGYEVDALDFILKPVHYSQFSMKMQKAVNRIGQNQQKYLVFPYEERKERVSTDCILYLEVKNHILQVITKEKTYAMRGSLQEMEKELEDCHFSRCNNCYLVNLKNVLGVQKDMVLLEGHELIISRPRKKQFLLELSAYLGGGYR